MLFWIITFCIFSFSHLLCLSSLGSSLSFPNEQSLTPRVPSVPSQCDRASPSRPRWGSASSLGRRAARCGSSALPAGTLGLISSGWKTAARWRMRAAARRRGGRWVWRTWRRSTAGSTPATCPILPEKSTPPTRWKSYVSHRGLLSQDPPPPNLINQI